MKKIIIKHKKEAALRRFHPWVFSGAILKKDKGVREGDVVEVHAEKGECLATGHYQEGSIAIRILAFKSVKIDAEFWKEKLENAYQVRQLNDLPISETTNCYRLVHAEGDQLSGLIIDIYHKTAVIQCHSIGMHKSVAAIAEALKAIYGDRLEAIYDKSAETLPKHYAEDIENSYLLGESGAQQVLEHGHTFLVNWETGQKTGFFLDQRDNRQLLSTYAKGKSVLNAFSYSGGFSIYALKAGATKVDSVDASAKAIALCDQNIEANGFTAAQHQSFQADVLQFLQETTTVYDLMIVDPPAFAKSLKKKHNAVQGYKRLNALALSKIKAGGIVFTFSCSQVIDRSLFYNTIVAAALEAGRSVRVLHHLSQPADHPVHLAHPEGAYLKGLVLYVA